MTETTIQNELVSEIYIAAEPERIFQALVDPAQVPQWWGQKGIYHCTEFKSDFRVGGDWKTTGIGPDGGPFTAHGKYLEINPPRSPAYTWVASWTGSVQTTVRWELSSSAKGTQVTVRHCGLAAHPELAQAYRGWPRMLGWLRLFIEKGETAEMR